MRTTVLLALFTSTVLADLPEGASLEIKIQELKGEVDYQAAPKTPWKAAQVGDVLPVGAKLCTGVDSGAVLLFGTNSVAMLREASVMNIISFGMQGDGVVAEVKIDPGVCSVSVQQLPQFQTDFRVTTPRLTCSVKGSGYTAKANGDEVPDHIDVDHGFARAAFPNGQSNTSGPGGQFNSNNLNVDQNALAGNVFNAVDGMARNEGDPNQLANLGQDIGVNAGDLNRLDGGRFFGNPGDNQQDGSGQGDGNQVDFRNATAQLTWDDFPQDQDLHVKVRYQDGTMFEVYYSNQDSPDGLVHLDRDDTNGFGPETITVDQFREGMYRYFVDNYDDEDGPIGSTNAVLTVQEQGGGNRVFNVNPQATEKYWHVFDFNVNAGGTATVVPANTYSNSEPPFPGN